MRGKQRKAADHRRAMTESELVASLQEQLADERKERTALIASAKEDLEAKSALAIRHARAAMQAEVDQLRGELEAECAKRRVVVEKVGATIVGAYSRNGAEPRFTAEEFEFLIAEVGGAFGSMCETLGLKVILNRNARRAGSKYAGGVLKRMEQEERVC